MLSCATYSIHVKIEGKKCKKILATKKQQIRTTAINYAHTYLLDNNSTKWVQFNIKHVSTTRHTEISQG